MTLQTAPIRSDCSEESAGGIRPLRSGVALRAWTDPEDERLDRVQRRWAVLWEVLAVLAITALGAGLRFIWLDKPAIWGDESATYQRICGSYADLINALQGVGFVPLHYQLYWWLRMWLLHRGQVMTPMWMRLPVATFSTLMVPAMYLLARQLVSKSTAIAVALITATSAYMMFYAHDAKMYADSWLFCTLDMAAFVWWLRKHSIMAWLSWIAAGAIAGGISAPGLGLLGVQLIWLIAQRHHRWWRTLLFVAGAAVIAAGPTYYYETFTKWGQQIQDEGWGASGLDWVNKYNRHRDGPDLLRFTATAYLFAWEWPAIDTVHDVEPKVLERCEEASAAVMVLLMLGTFPWPTRRRYRHLSADPPGAVSRPISSDESRWQIVAGLRRMWRTGAPTAWWRSTIWILVWIVVPAYGLYLASVKEPDSPMVWIAAARQWLADPVHATVAGATAIAAFYCCATSLFGRFTRTLQLIGVLLVPLLICLGLQELLVIKSPGSLWMPRYLGFIWPAVAIGGTVLLLRLPTVPLRWGAVGFVVALNLANGLERMIQYTEPPIPQVMKDLYDASQSHRRVVTVCDFIDGGFDPGRQAADGSPARYYALILGKTQLNDPSKQYWSWDFQPWLGRGSYPTETDPELVRNDVFDDSRANRLIVWHVHHEPAPPRDYTKALGPRWKLVSSQQFHLFVYWNWNQLNWLDREEFTRER